MGRLRSKKTGLPSPVAGVTLLELMVTLVTLGILLSTSVILMTGYLARQKLTNEAQRLRNFFVTTRERAKNQQENFCLQIDRTGPVVFRVYLDVNANFLCPETGTDTLVDSLTLDSNISIPTCSVNNTYWNPPSDHVPFFLAGGVIQLRKQTAPTVAITNPLGDFEIILISSALPPESRAREVELLFSMGRADLVPAGQLGLRNKIASVPFTPAPTPGYYSVIPVAVSFCYQ